jgi:hypothetical protein
VRKRASGFSGSRCSETTRPSGVSTVGFPPAFSFPLPPFPVVV